MGAGPQPEGGGYQGWDAERRGRRSQVPLRKMRTRRQVRAGTEAFSLHLGELFRIIYLFPYATTRMILRTKPPLLNRNAVPLLGITLLVFLQLSGCSTYQNITGYFNTFYNARRLFDE